MSVNDALALGLGYLVGSIPFGLLFVRLFSGRDVRAIGSGNIGATNASRASGWKVGLLTLLCDVLKGAVAVWLGYLLAPEPRPWTITAALITMPVLGHVFPVWLGFRGGKGVATAFGALAVADWSIVVAALVAFAALAIPTRFVSLGSVGAAVAAVIAAFAVSGWSGLTAGALAVCALVVARHRSNIARLLTGREPRFGNSSPPRPRRAR